APGGPPRPVPPPLGEQARLHRRQRFVLAHDAVPSRPLPRPPAPPPQRVRADANRNLHFDHLDRRVASVGHPDVDARWSRPRGPGSPPPAAGFGVRPSHPPLPTPPPPPRPLFP